MFVEEKPQGEVTEKTATARAAELIRKGHSMIDESSQCYLMAGRGCAIGAMWVAAGRTESEWRSHGMLLRSKESNEKFFADALGLPSGLCAKISALHYAGMPRLEIAEMLERDG